MTGDCLGILEWAVANPCDATQRDPAFLRAPDLADSRGFLRYPKAW